MSSTNFHLNRFLYDYTEKIIRETDLSDLSDSWRSNISVIFSDKSDKSASIFRRIDVSKRTCYELTKGTRHSIPETQ